MEKMSDENALETKRSVNVFYFSTRPPTKSIALGFHFIRWYDTSDGLKYCRECASTFEVNVKNLCSFRSCSSSSSSAPFCNASPAAATAPPLPPPPPPPPPANVAPIRTSKVVEEDADGSEEEEVEDEDVQPKKSSRL